ncbi:MAG: sugar phosphate isomerase/epimerase [Oscillospiraceae bacterium]|nr:sugar phosphate isomerase/epimerase [Oscillospiraceae bacterium]
MKRKYAVITGFMGQIQDRFSFYGVDRTFEEMVQVSSTIKGCSGLEVVYPQQIDDPLVQKKILDNYGMAVAALNVNVKSELKWQYGSISSPKAEIRKEAVEYIKTGLDYAAELGTNKVTVSFLNDGSDYPFELDFKRAFEHAVDSIRQAASYRNDVKLSLEYKLSEPRIHALLGNAGKMAYLCEQVGLPNVGVTLDTGHALQSLEVLSDSVSFLAVTNRLFHIHVNDNYRNWDWDMVPGTVNFWEFLEFCLYLDRFGYDEFITADVFPQRHDAVRIMEKTFEWMDYMFDISERIAEDNKIFDMMNNGADAFECMDYVKHFVR